MNVAIRGLVCLSTYRSVMRGRWLVKLLPSVCEPFQFSVAALITVRVRVWGPGVNKHFGFIGLGRLREAKVMSLASSMALAEFFLCFGVLCNG